MGLPRALRTDNGPPFATTGAGQLSQLAVWWLKLGIQLDRIDPGHPEQNGRHERFHLTLQQETTTPPAPTPARQQRRFDRDAAANLIRSGRMKRLGNSRRRASMWPRPGPIPRGSRSRGMTPPTRCAASSRQGEIKWQGRVWCLRAERSGATRSGRGGGDRAGRLARAGSCTSNSGALIARPAGLRRRGTGGATAPVPGSGLAGTMNGIAAHGPARGGDPAVEMPLLWKPQNDFHSTLGNLAQNARFPQIG